MPTYQYQCTECGEGLEAVQKFTDDALTECPNCKGRLKKVFSAVGIVFKGSGFYRTDSRSSISSASSGSESATKSDTKSESTSPSKSESKPAAKTTTAKKRTRIPATDTIRANDTLSGIAARWGTTVEKLQELNPDLDPQGLVAGQKIKLRE